jgi:hypothetical protein
MSPTPPDHGSQPGTLPSASEVSIDSSVGRTHLSVDDQIKLDDQSLRRWMATRIVWTFIAGNALTVTAIGALCWLDQSNIVHAMIQPEDRIIDHRVVMALIAGTTVQVGTIAVIIARYLFPGATVRDL